MAAILRVRDDSGNIINIPAIVGSPGSSIATIERTEGTGAPGTTDTYTITLTDGSTTTFSVYNGKDGTGSGDMSASVYDTENRRTDVFTYADNAASTAESNANSYTDERIAEIPTPDVGEQISEHNADTTAHPDIREAISGLTAADLGAPTVEEMNEAIAGKYSSSNPPPYPVTSVNGQTGDVTVEAEVTREAVEAVLTGEISSHSHDYAASSHTHAASDITSGTFATARIPSLAASKISAGTFAGQVVAKSSGQTYSTYCLRNTRLASSDTTPTVNGQICWTYG